jgi:UDP-2,3-diacylglucosamine pyrophosphatase LpxH
MDKKTLTYKTLILSDVHLGTADCKINEVNHLLKNIRCRKLILNGDIIDGWRLKRKGGWSKAHSRFIRLLLKKVEKKDTHVVYLRGNHDDILGRFLPLTFEGIEFVEEYIHETERCKYLVFHGDVFDSVTSNLNFISHLGAIGYDWLLSFNRLYNKWRALRGKEYYSISKKIKAKVKSAVNFISKFEDSVAALAKARNCQGAICGHIHTPDDKMLDGIHYLNSGDWVESLTAIVEHMDGRMEVISYARFCALIGDAPTVHDPHDLEDVG